MENALEKYYSECEPSKLPSEASLSHTPQKVILTNISTFHPNADESLEILPNMSDMSEFSSDMGGSGIATELPLDIDPVDNYQLGFEAGQAQSQDTYNQSLAVMQNALDTLQITIKDAVMQIEQSHSQVLRQCLSALLPKLADHSLRTEMQALISSASQGQINGTITARYHPENEVAATFLATLNDASSCSDEPKLVCAPSEEMEPFNVSFNWSQGCADMSPHDIAAACLALLTPTEG